MAEPKVSTNVAERLLALTVVEVGASATIQDLLAAAGVAFHPRFRRITLIPAGPAYMAMDAPATANTMPLAAGVGYEFAMRNDADVRLYAAGATKVTVVQES